jgi:CRP-like cAMP-binding protein
LISIQDEVN